MINEQGMRRAAIALLAVAGLTGIAPAAIDQDYYFQFAGYNAPSASLQGLFGPALRSPLDAAGEGFDFGGPLDPLRNFNVISQVFRANQTVSISPQITLQPGDLTFAYTLDYSAGGAPGGGGVVESPLTDFQLLRVVVDEVFFNVHNPGPIIALDNVLGGAYDTAAEFNGKALKAYPDGLTGHLADYPEFPYLSNLAQFSWDANHQVMPGEKAMVLLFARNVTYMEIGSAAGTTGEGGNVLAGGPVSHNEQFPILVPVVPEPASLLLLTLGGILLQRRRAPGRQQEGKSNC